jgi:hypothetical protein
MYVVLSVLTLGAAGGEVAQSVSAPTLYRRAGADGRLILRDKAHYDCRSSEDQDDDEVPVHQLRAVS